MIARTARARGVAVALCLAVAVATGSLGCSDSSGGGTPDAAAMRDGAAATDGAAGDAGSGGDVGSAPDAAPPCTARYLETVRGRIVDERGAGVANAWAQLCVRLQTDALVCLAPPLSDSNGDFVINVPEVARCMKSASMRALVQKAMQATTYCDVSLAGSGKELTLTTPYVLFDTKPAASLPPEGDIKASRTVRFADGLEIDVTPERLFASGVGYGGLASRRLPPTTPNLCFVDKPATLEAVYAFSPESAIGGGGFDVRVPNDSKLAPGTKVALYVLGGLDCQLPGGDFVDEAEWRRYGEGTVSADGRFVTGTIPCLNWFGYGKIAP